MIKFRNVKVKLLADYKISDSGLIKTPTGKIRRPFMTTGMAIFKAQRFPEFLGLGNINIRHL